MKFALLVPVRMTAVATAVPAMCRYWDRCYVLTPILLRRFNFIYTRVKLFFLNLVCNIYIA